MLVQLLVAVHRREERGRFERGVAGVAEFLGDTGERRVRRVGLLDPVPEVPGGCVGDARLDVQAPSERFPRLLAVELDRPAAPIVEAALANGLVIGSAGERVLRLTPPLTLSHDEAALGLELLEGAFA